MIYNPNIVCTNYGEIRKKGLDLIELYQDEKRFVFVTDIEKLGALLELHSGLVFKYEIAKGCNYFYNFWLEQPIERIENTSNLI